MLLALGDFVGLHLQLATQLLTSEMIHLCTYYLYIFWFIPSFVVHFREMVFASS